VTDIVEEARLAVESCKVSHGACKWAVCRFAQAVSDLDAKAKEADRVFTQWAENFLDAEGRLRERVEKSEQRVAELEAALRAANDDLIKSIEDSGW
jgi:hypothetical protein